jgi:hypothetical protein
MWTKQPTDEVIRLIEWIEYPQNTSKILILNSILIATYLYS